MNFSSVSQICRRLLSRLNRQQVPSTSKKSRRASRRLCSESLETRQLLAADLAGFRHNFFDAEDVNDDGVVSPVDALMVINAMHNTESRDVDMFTDVNADGHRSPIDALMVINRINRGGDRADGRLPGSVQDELVPDLPSEIRTLDGTGNNLENPTLGSAGVPLLRIAEADYGDGISTPAGADRPSTREISNVLSDALEEGTRSDRDLSAFIYVWGQFIDHDIDLSLNQEEGESFDIPVPTGDPQFDPTSSGTATIPMTRSAFDSDTGTSVDNPRQQVNSITAYLDGSMVYGSDQLTSDSLRLFSGGEMLINDDGLLPTGADGNVMAGDIRAGENPALTSLQTLFVREHNRLAAEIVAGDPSLSDEEVFQQARAIVIAEIQAITFNEFLPALLGRQAISRYAGYDESVAPSIANEFSTAAFRFGHSTLNDDIEFFDNDGRAIRDEISLAESFFNPTILQETGIDSILKYDASTQAQEIDLQVVDSLRNALFGPPGSGGLDLVALNIQRGRDHGLADYNATREAYSLGPVESFAEITSDVELQQKLESLYGDVNNIDLWVGLMAEDHVRGASVGQLTQAIIADQFERLRDGDRFWYENVYSGRELRQLQQTSLSDVIQRNTDVEGLQQNVFFMRAEVSGRVTAADLGPQVSSPNRDNNRGPRQESGVEGVAVELLDDGGNVIDTTTTDRRGNYSFDSFAETGDYSVRLVNADTGEALSEEVVDFLISNGSTRLRNLSLRLTV